MKLFGRKRDPAQTESPSSELDSPTLTEESATTLRVARALGSEGRQAAEENGIEGERTIPSVNRARSLQSRMTGVLAIALMGLLGAGLLGWYYKQMLARSSQTRASAQAAVQRRSQSEMPLPPLGRIERPRVEPIIESDPTALEQVLGPEPPLYADAPSPWEARAHESAASRSKSPEALALARRLAGPVFTAAADVESAWQKTGSTHIYSAAEGVGTAQTSGSELLSVGTRAAETTALAERLKPTLTSAVDAQILPTQRLLLPKGAFIDCTLETAIDSTLPGMTTCVMATDSFSADGQVVLLERGTKLVGETRGDVRQGAARVFVVWTQARTPTGVVIALDSPGTDELGRSGLPGEVNRHFWQRFGAAILVSVIDGAVQSALQSSHDGGTVIVNPSSTQSIMTEVLKSTINIPPTVVKQHGDRIQVLVARDLDFRSVYELHPTAGR